MAGDASVYVPTITTGTKIDTNELTTLSGIVKRQRLIVPDLVISNSDIANNILIECRVIRLLLEHAFQTTVTDDLGYLIDNLGQCLVRATNVTLAAATVSPLQTLINGLTSDGVFAKLDRLWVFAQATEAAALVDLVAGATATAVNSPTFTANVGYTGSSGGGAYISSNYDPSVNAVNYSRDSACFFAWNNTSSPSDFNPLCGQGGGATDTRIYPIYAGDSKLHWGVNGDTAGTASPPGSTGLYLCNRTVSTTETIDINGSQFDSQAVASVAPAVGSFQCFREGAASNYQGCAFGFGGGLTAGDRTNIYNRLRTYMTAVGVP